MSKASEYAEACWKHRQKTPMFPTQFHPHAKCHGPVTARVTEDGSLDIGVRLIYAQDIPAFIKWLKETFL